MPESGEIFFAGIVYREYPHTSTDNISDFDLYLFRLTSSPYLTSFHVVCRHNALAKRRGQSKQQGSRQLQREVYAFIPFPTRSTIFE
jgi:hypothetical protein